MSYSLTPLVYVAYNNFRSSSDVNASQRDLHCQQI